MRKSVYYPTVELEAGAEENGMAEMVHGLVQQNLKDKPHKLRDFFKLHGLVAIVAEDAGVSLTLDFDRGQLTVRDGIWGIPDLTIRADSDDIINLSLIELSAGLQLPDPRGTTARQILAAMREGRIHVYGALGHLPTMLRLTRVMSVN